MIASYINVLDEGFFSLFWHCIFFLCFGGKQFDRLNRVWWKNQTILDCWYNTSLYYNNSWNFFYVQRNIEMIFNTRHVIYIFSHITCRFIHIIRTSIDLTDWLNFLCICFYDFQFFFLVGLFVLFTWILFIQLLDPNLVAVGGQSARRRLQLVEIHVINFMQIFKQMLST